MTITEEPIEVKEETVEDKRTRKIREIIERDVKEDYWLSVGEKQKREVEERLKKALESGINSDTFTPTGKTLGMGCWGIIDEYEDLTGQRWAIKRFSPNEIAQRQMQERNLTPEEVMRKEAVPLSAAQHNVAPRIIERDKDGELYVGMPVYKETLEDQMSRELNQDRIRLGNRVRDIGDPIEYEKETKREVKKQLRDRLKGSVERFKDITEAIAYLHFTENRAHGDIKPKNVLLDKNRRAFLTDLGSSTCISISGEDPRDNIGDANYRAPECYKPESRPTDRSDVWSAGALFYELLTGNQIKYGIENLHELPEKQARKVLRKKIALAPRKTRKLLRRCLDPDPEKRYSSGFTLKEDLEKLERDLDGWQSFKNMAKMIGLASIPAAFISFCVWRAAVYEPQKLEMPNIKKEVSGMLYRPGSEKDKGQLEFEAEEFPIPEPFRGIGLDRYAKDATENRVVAYFVKTHAQTAKALGGSYNGYNDHQFKTYIAATDQYEREAATARGGFVWPIWAKSIEVALTQSKTKNGKIDLEDTMAITRVGSGKVSEAQRVSGSLRYQDYRYARDTDGEYIIPKEEQRFIETWLSQFHADTD